ncbi:MAG TPA: DMT family transporter [Dehalococcoidia bacterium]|nr:DMT family transporter [Dehalococcoidia bacterium]
MSTEAPQRNARGYVFAFSAAFAYAAAQVLARHGVSDFHAPLVGTTIALAFGTLGFIAIAARNLSTPVANFRRGALFFMAAGVFSSIGVSSIFSAVDRADVVIVSPISSIYPLFTLLFAAVVLGDLERLNPRIFAGAALVVLGVAIISVS